MALPIVLGYLVNEEKEGCDLYAISEPNFFLMVYQRQANIQFDPKIPSVWFVDYYKSRRLDIIFRLNSQ